MKLACTSGALAREIESGELTQLEFVDLCARDFACDGVVLDVRHFPRTDDDYLAQLKKMAVDWGLCIAALGDAHFFHADRERMRSTFAQALALGAPLVAAPLAAETEFAWSEQLERLGAAVSLAKQLNVTLALRNSPGTFAASTHHCKRVVKETDSAWLRYGPQPQGFDAGSDVRSLAENTVLIWSDAGSQSADSIRATLAVFPAYRGFVVLDDAAGATPAALREGIALWRDALCRTQEKLNHK